MTGRCSRRVRALDRRALTRAIGVAAFAVAVAACSGVDESEPPTAADPPVATGDAAGSAPDDADGGTSAPDDTTPTDTTPADTTPAETSPAETAPAEPPAAPPAEESDPEDSAPPTSPPEPPVEEPETSEPSDDAAGVEDPTGSAPDDDTDPALVALAVAGFVALLGVAAWWMFRRDDPDADIGHPDPHDWPDDQMSL